ncbi:MAG: GNAT family N-acetyltransferase [Desulfoferrobacter sp.]
MQFELLDRIDDAKWDRMIAPWPGRLIFHQAAWLRFLIDSRPDLRLVRHKLVRGSSTKGFFVGFIEKRGPFLMMGSPLYGWFTDFMGPVSDHALDVPAFLHALEKWCLKENVPFVQIGHPALPADNMSRAGYLVNTMSLYRIPLANSEKTMWEHLSGKCRNRIRKGQRSGLSVEECYDDSIVEEFYAQHTDVFAHQGLSPKYPVNTVKALVKNLQEAGMILCLKICYEGETAATGLFPHDDQYLYSFGIASWIKFRHLCPNELLYWSAMQWGETRGLKGFMIGGKYREPPSGGIFKEKFNAEIIPFQRFTKTLTLSMRAVYWLYRISERIRSQPGPKSV